MKAIYFTTLCTLAFANHAFAGTGCDLNLRFNNKTQDAVTIIASQSSASKAGLNLWNPIGSLEDVAIDPEGSGTDSHSKQAVELSLPCWTGKVDFRFKYLQGAVDRWKYRDAVSVDSGDTIQINIP
jgi:hypothetical protein